MTDSDSMQANPWPGDRRMLARFLAVAVTGSVLTALALGIPTDIVPNPWFTRMTPIEANQYAFWIASSVLTGALVGTYALTRQNARGSVGSGVGGGLFSLLAVGCPVCNKVVVLLLGFSGAFQYFAPIQPYLGALGVILAGTALFLRLRWWKRSCAVPADARS